MITVVIYINNTPIYTRSAVNIGEENEKGETQYLCDSGNPIRHMRGDGAVKLAKKMLDSVKDILK